MTMNIAPDEISLMIYYHYKKKGLSQQESLESHLLTFGFHYNWYAEFNWAREYFEDEPRAARLRSTVTPENIEAVRQLINVDPRITYQQKQDVLQIGSVATESIL